MLFVAVNVRLKFGFRLLRPLKPPAGKTVLMVAPGWLIIFCALIFAVLKEEFEDTAYSEPEFCNVPFKLKSDEEVKLRIVRTLCGILKSCIIWFSEVLSVTEPPMALPNAPRMSDCVPVVTT